MAKVTYQIFLALIVIFSTNHSFCQELISSKENPILTGPDEITASFYGPKIDLNDEGSISFSWRLNNYIDAKEITYELEIISLENRKRKSVKTFRTQENSIIISGKDLLLVYGGNYSAGLNLIVENENASKKINNLTEPIEFSFLPECTPPKNFRVVEKGTDYIILEWDGDTENEGGIEYELNQKFSKSTSNKGVQSRVITGNRIKIDGLVPTLPYDFEIRKVCSDPKNDFTPHSKWVKISHLTLQGQHPISLPQFNCGDSFNWTCDGQNSTNGPLYVGDTIYLHGFPILIDSLIFNCGYARQSMDSCFAGYGYMAIPFSERVVYVYFADVVKIDPEGNVCNEFAWAQGICCEEGLDKGHSTTCGNYDFPPAQFGGAICIPPVDTSLIDDYGFDTSGQYVRMPPYPGWNPGDPYDPNYDPNGFDSSGVHRETNSIYGPNGCSRDSLDAFGNKCDPGYCPNPYVTPPCPYYWLDTLNQGPPTQAGEEFEELVRDRLDSLVEIVLNEMTSLFQDSTSNKENLCNGIRTIMNAKMDVLEFNTDYIYGEDSIYFKKGLHENFTAEPKYLAEHRAERDSNVFILEKKHVELYHCDLQLSNIEEVLIDLGILNTPTGIADIVNYLSEIIRRLSEEEIEDLQDPVEFEEWLRGKVWEYVNENGSSAGSGNKPSSKLQNGDKSSFFGGDNFYEPKLEELLGGENFNDFKTKKSLAPILSSNECQDSTRLPIKLSKRIGNKDYTIYLDNILVTFEHGGEVDAYFPLEIPSNGQTVLFSGTGLSFLPTGLKNGSARLALENDIDIRISNAAKIVIKGGVDSTFVQWDCLGVDSIGIDGELKICREYLIPVDPGTLTPIEDENELVTGRFTARMQQWGQFYAGLDVDPFVVVGAENVGWTISEAYFDFSDIASPPNIQAPQGYTHPAYGANGFDGEWKGVYFKELSVMVSSDFSGDTTTTKIGVQNMIFDNKGFSGNVFLTPLLSLDKGNLNGWAFSIDTLEVNILHNQLKGAGFNGHIQVPLFSKDKNPTTLPVEEECFKYTALFQPHNKYYFSVEPPTSGLKAPLFSAGSITLEGNSLVEILYDDGFQVKSTLHGKVQIGVEEGGKSKFNVPEIKFENLRIQNFEPYFISTGVWKMPDSLGTKVAGFELRLDNFEMDDYEPILNISARVLLGDKKDDLYIDASGSVSLEGEFKEVLGRQRWVFNSFKVNEFNLVGSFPGVPYVQGYIKFYEDNSTYGDGFQGGVGMQIEALNNVSIRSVAQFGKINDYKYFFIDALVCNLNITMGAITLDGLGGGVSYHMFRDTVVTSGLLCDNDKEIPTTIGHSLSGAVYSPNNSVGLGLKLIVAISGGTETAFSGNATFSIFFNEGSGNGIRNIAIYGNCKVMAPPNIEGLPTFDKDKNEVPDNGGAINGFFLLSIDFGNPEEEEKLVVHGDFKIHINLYDQFITGGGDIELHVEEEYWYFKAGSPLPGKQIFVSFNVNGQSLASVGMYLQLGTRIDPMPDMPDKIYALTGASRSSNINDEREWSDDAKQGLGFSFGAYLKLGSQDEMKFLIFYAKLDIEIGFDLVVKKYSEQIKCAGSNQSPGINGWFSKGQMYAYLDAGMGIEAKLFGVTKRFEIVQVTGGIALQSQMPNPFWAEGAFGIKYNVLGLIKGKGQFKFEVGEKCNMYVEGGAENLSVIREINPAPHQEVPFPVNWKPTVDFNFPMNDRLSLELGENESIHYDLTLVSAEILDENQNIYISDGDLSYDKTKFTFKPDNYFPGNDTFFLHIIARIDSLGQEVATEDTIVKFYTGDPLDYVPEINVIGSYPINGQYNFYRNEIQDAVGYIQLEYGQPDLFFQYGEYKGRYSDVGGNFIDVELEYLPLEKRIEFDIPSNFLSNNALYKFEILYKATPRFEYGYTDPGAEQGVSLAAEEKKLYSMYFRVSEYDNLKEKVFSLQNLTSFENNIESLFYPYSIGVPQWQGLEPFDKFEILGKQNKFSPLIAFSMDDKVYDDDGTGNKPGKELINANKIGDVGIPGYTFYEKYPLSSTCFNGVKPIEIRLDRNEPPSTEINLRHGPNTWSQAWRNDLDELIITEEKFLNNQIPSSGYNQYLINRSFSLFASDYAYVKQQVLGYYDDITYEFLEPPTVPWEVAAQIAEDCLDEAGISIHDFYPGKTFWGDGKSSYKIYIAYKLPTHSTVNYTNISIQVPNAN